MKLKAYSQNNPARHLILHTVKRFLWLPVVILIFTGLAFTGMEIINNEPMPIPAIQMPEEKIFYMFHNTEIWFLFPYLIMFTSAFSAYIMFSFLFKSKSAAMMLLTGVSRTTLFFTRYLYGLLSALIPTLLTFSLLLEAGADNVGKHLVLSQNTVIILLMVGLTVIYSYTVSAIAASLCGRKIEFFAVSSVFFFGIQGLMLFINAVCSSYLHGFAYPIREETNLPFTLGDMFDKYSHLSINTIFKDAFKEYSISGMPFRINADLKIYSSELICLTLATLVLGLIAWIVFKNRKAEFNGKSNANNILSIACTVIFALTVASLPLLGGNTLWYALGSLILFAAVCLAAYAFFNGSYRYMLKALKFALPSVAVICIFGITAYFGMFGYSSKVPKANDVQSVKITYKGDTSDLFVGKQGHGYANLSSTAINYSSYLTLESEKDIGIAIDIHKMLIEDGSRFVSDTPSENYSDTVVYGDYYIVYQLKDGSEMIRCFSKMKLTSLYKTLKVADTDAFKELNADYIKSKVNYGDKIYFSDNMLSSYTKPELSQTQLEQLLNAISKDIKGAGFEQLYHPQEECLGVIWLRANNHLFNLEGSKEVFQQLKFESPVFVYKSFTETLNWLESNGFSYLFDNSCTVKSIDIYELDYYARDSMNNYAIDRHFLSKYNSDEYRNSPTTHFIESVPESDFDEILQNGRLQYFTDVGNRYAIITLINKDGEEISTVKFLVD